MVPTSLGTSVGAESRCCTVGISRRHCKRATVAWVVRTTESVEFLVKEFRNGSHQLCVASAVEDLISDLRDYQKKRHLRLIVHFGC